MAMDTPATIAIIGAGPIGLEAALYARFLGYDVHVLERGRVAEHVRRWGHVELFTPFRMNCSPLGLAALSAQSETYRPPDPDAQLNGKQWVEQYLAPLSRTDLLHDSIIELTEVVSVTRPRWLKSERVGDAERGEAPFQLLLQQQSDDSPGAERVLTADSDSPSPPDAERVLSADNDSPSPPGAERVLSADSDSPSPPGTERVLSADIVIDVGGVLSTPNWLGAGGGPAIGERALRRRSAVTAIVPDIRGASRARYANRHTLVVGAGYSAVAAIVELTQLREEAPETRATWVVRHDRAEPVRRIADDRLSLRDAIAQRANLAAKEGAVALRAGRQVVSVEPLDGDRLRVLLAKTPQGLDDSDDDSDDDQLQDDALQKSPAAEDERRSAESEELIVDELLSLVGYHPDQTIESELQAHWCYASDGPMRLAAQLMSQESADCLDAPAGGADALCTPEPHFYVLGAKSYGRNSQFLYATGLRQIRDLFARIGDRAELDLYRENASTLKRLD